MRYFSLVKIHGVLTPCSERNTTVAVCKDEDRALKINFQQLWYLFYKLMFTLSEYSLIAVLSIWGFFAWQQSVSLLFGPIVFEL